MAYRLLNNKGEIRNGYYCFPAIANSIGLASEYLPLLDEVYKAESKTAILDTAQDMVRWSDEYHTFYLFETDMVGLGDYSRNGGFVRGDVTAQWSLRASVGSWSAVPD